MFGLIGKGEAMLDSANAGGELAGGFRIFSLPARSFVNASGMIIEPDYSSEGNPSHYFQYNSNVAVPYNPLTTVHTITSLNPMLALPSVGGYLNAQRILRANPHNNYLGNVNNGIRFRHPSPIAPLTRDYRARISNPANIVLMTFASDGSMGTVIAQQDAEWVGDMKNQLAQFPNCRSVIFTRQGISKIDEWPASLEILYLRNCVYLDTIGKLPRTVKHISWGVGDGRPASYFNNAMEGLTELEDLYFAIDGGYPQTFGLLSSGITGIIDLTGKDKLKVYTMTQCPGLSHIFPATLGSMEVFDQRNTGIAAANVPALEAIVDAPNLLSFFLIDQPNLTWPRSFVNADIGNSLRWLGIVNCGLIGDITINAPRPGIIHFWTGNLDRSTANSNVLQTLDISGLTGVTFIDLTGCKITSLILPTTLTLQTLYLYGNKLSVTTNPNLVNQIRACTSITDLRLGIGAVDLPTGQDSVDGLGNNLNLDTLVNMTLCRVSQCKLTGTLTLPNVARITTLECEDNPLAGIANLAAHGSTITGLLLDRCPNLAVSLTALTKVQSFRARFSGLPVIDFSGRTDPGNIGQILGNDNPNLVTVTMSAVAGAARISLDFHFFNCPNLSAINNMTNIDFVATVASQRRFHMYNCPLMNIAYPFGVNNFLPGSIQIQNNNMSLANVDGTINNIYQNRQKFWGSGSKALNIAGSNAVPTGVYQSPAGFVPGINDGIPANAKEQAYVLVNNYGWVVTMN